MNSSLETRGRRVRVPLWLVVAAAVVIVGPVLLIEPQAVAQVEAAAEAEALQTPRLSFLELLLKGQYFMIPIALCSLIGAAIILERLFAIRRSAVIPPGFLASVKAVFRDPEKDRAAALQFCRAHPAQVARVVGVGIRKLPQGQETVEQAIEDAGANEVAKLRRNLRLLYGISAVAPMLGLLGTVWGMIQAFQAASAGALGKADTLATGIYEALVTTLAGLMVAIPCLVFYYYFQGKIERIISEMNDLSEEFIEHYLEPPAGGSAATVAAPGPAAATAEIPAGAAPATA
jgi:biopolymer transport protein ExbB